MAPAPDEYPDFDSMTPEEQMAWLESLARRQGANAEEFLTAADQEIPVPEDVEIDEPGYVPYSAREAGRMPSAAEEPEASAAAEETAAEPEEVAKSFATVDDAEFQARAFETAAEMTDEVEPSAAGMADLEGADEGLEEAELADPMTWLGSLAAQPDDAALLADLERAGREDELVADWSELERTFDEPAAQSELSAALDFAAAEEFDLDDILGLAEAGVAEEDAGALDQEDSAGWLEGRAVRAGSEEEQAQAETVSALGAPDEGALRALESDQSEVLAPQGEAFGAGAFAEAEPADEVIEEDILGGADPMTWLETLARRQGASPEELTTEADLEIPVLPEDTVVDEPGYTEYSPFGILPPHRDEPATEAAGREADAGQAAPDELEALGESLGWLQEFTEEPPADLHDWLTIEDSFADADLREESATEGAEQPSIGETDVLAGMTDDEIEQALLRGELTPEQELAWLKRGAQELAGAPEQGEAAPAVPADLPDWLQQMRDEAIAATEFSPADAALPDWLEEPGDVDADAADETEALWGAAEGAAEELELGEAEVSESELAAFLAGEIAPEQADELAEALDEEFERRLRGDETEPEWYAEAVSEAAAPEPPLAEAEPIEMPDWLVEPDEEAAVESELPAWLAETELAETEGESPDSVAPAPEWLEELRVEESDLAWLAEEGRSVPPEVSAGAAARQAAIPEGELFESYRHRLEEAPDDHATRLALARTLRAHGQIAPSLDHYETLVESSHLLEDVANDLSALVDEQPEQPRLRRLLGDALMRRGRLQEALDAYRAALERL